MSIERSLQSLKYEILKTGTEHMAWALKMSPFRKVYKKRPQQLDMSIKRFLRGLNQWTCKIQTEHARELLKHSMFWARSVRVFLTGDIRYRSSAVP
jgi:hypothetical protein